MNAWGWDRLWGELTETEKFLIGNKYDGSIPKQAMIDAIKNRVTNEAV